MGAYNGGVEDMDAIAVKPDRTKKMVITLAVFAVCFALALMFLPVVSEKIVAGIVLVLFAGMLFMSNDTGRYICKRILLALLTVSCPRPPGSMTVKRGPI